MAEDRALKNEQIWILVQKTRKGDREAFMTITRVYQKKVFLLAYSFFHDREDALDVVQETFLRLYQKIHLFRQGRNFQNWLLQIARNICIDYYRKHHRRKKELEQDRDVEEMNSPLTGQNHSHDAVDLKAIFSRCLKRLSHRQRMIFVMKHYNQLKYKEIAQILDISTGTVKSLHFKAVRNLRALMAPYLGRSL